MAQLEAVVREFGVDPAALEAPPHVWRFRVAPAGRRFGWQGQVYASDRATGVLEVRDPAFAAALRRRAVQDRIEEIPAGEA